MGEEIKNKIYNEYTIYGTEKANRAVYDGLKNEYEDFRVHLKETVPLFIDETIKMCKKSVLALCKTFDSANISPLFGGGNMLDISSEGQSLTGIKIASAIGGFIVGALFPVVGVFGGLTSLFLKYKEYKENHDEGNINDQKRIMSNLIDETTTALKEYVRSQEKQIMNQIAKYI